MVGGETDAIDPKTTCDRLTRKDVLDNLRQGFRLLVIRHSANTSQQGSRLGHLRQYALHEGGIGINAARPQ
jgi:hypothetical protein